jgi:hypothetical protein
MAAQHDEGDRSSKMKVLMDDSSGSPAWRAHIEFGKAHASAMQMLRVATQDYAAARCLLLNGLFTGLGVGAQTIEKFLKAYILFFDPDRKVRRLKHSLLDLLDEVNLIAPQLELIQFREVVERFEKHYAARYPDDPKRSISMTTADLVHLDRIVVLLSDHMLCPRHVKYRSGIFALISFPLDHPNLSRPDSHWVVERNEALATHLPRILSECSLVMDELFLAIEPQTATEDTR